MTESQNRLKNFAVAAVAGAVAMSAYSFYVEPRWLQVTRTRVVVPRLPVHLEGLRIALISDFHAGNGTPLWLLRRACRLAMRERPDLIALTGDLVSAESAVAPGQVIDAVSMLRAPLGVYVVPGNHDHAWGIGPWKKAMRDYDSVVDLTNKAVIYERGDARIGIAGVDDLVTGDPDFYWLRWLKRADLVLLFAHNPDHAERLKDVNAQVDLVLSGHTHAGQVRLPLFGAIRNPSSYDDVYEQGLIKRPWTQVYVSRGIGTVHLPIRFLARPEVSILDLVTA